MRTTTTAPMLHHRALCCLAMVMLVLASCGCRKRLRGIDCPGQTLLDKGRAVLQQADGVEAVVAPVRVPWASGSSPIGFNIQLANLSEQPLRLVLDRIELRDPLGRLLTPLPPERLLRAFGTGSGEVARAQTVAYRPHRARRHYHRHYVRRYRYPRHYYGRYTWGWGYARPYYDHQIVGGWGYGGFDYDDSYTEARRTARFLSELLTDQAVEPDHVAVGHVVFAYRLHSDDQLTLLIHVARQDLAPAAGPESAGELSASETAPKITTLEFRFEEK